MFYYLFNIVAFEAIANEFAMHYIIYHISGVFKNKIFRAYSRESLISIAYKLEDSKLTPHLRLPEDCDIVLDICIEVSCSNISPVSQHLIIKGITLSTNEQSVVHIPIHELGRIPGVECIVF